MQLSTNIQLCQKHAMTRALALVTDSVFTWTRRPEMDTIYHYITLYIISLYYNWSPIQLCITTTLVVKVFNVIHVKCCHGINNDLHHFVKRVCIHCNNVIIQVTN